MGGIIDRKLHALFWIQKLQTLIHDVRFEVGEINFFLLFGTFSYGGWQYTGKEKKNSGFWRVYRFIVDFLSGFPSVSWGVFFLLL